MQLAAERPPAAGAAAPRRARLLGLAALVLMTHLWLVENHWPDRLGPGAAEAPPRRIEVAFVRELAPVAPPTQAPAPPPRRLAPRASERAASAPQAEVPVPVPVAQDRSEPLPAPEVPAAAPVEIAAAAPPVEAAAPAASTESADTASVLDSRAAAPAAAASQAGAAFEWPPSTRLSYTLSGDYRGPVQGRAQVEWLRSGTRYQVHLDVSVGPSFAPLLSRRITSEGEITEQGLQPRRYDEETRAGLGSTRRLHIALEGDVVRLPGGAQLPRPAGVQDSASQFVQMTWLFTTQPHLLQRGRTIELPLALPRRVENWLYDVVGTETLATPAGAVEAVHVKPRREAGASGRGSDLAAEFWVAPSLQYLPVRIVIRQDAQTYVDLLIERLPQQAQPGR